MLLKTASWQEVEAYLEKSDGIIIPIGSTEQHGPTGLLGTDALCPEIIATRTAAQYGDVMIAPTVNFGVAQHHLGFAGTMALRPSTYMALLKDLIDSLTVHGFRHLLFYNGHGGNVATVEATFAEVYAASSFGETTRFRDVKCRLFNWWNNKDLIALSQELHGPHEGKHATSAEIAVTYHGYPEAVKTAELTPEIAPDAEFFYDAADYRRRFPDGRIGSAPQRATPETGRRIVELAVKSLREVYTGFLQED